MAEQELYDDFANVRDEHPDEHGVLQPGATGNGQDDDTAAIQRAIDNPDGKPVLFPAGDTDPVNGGLLSYVITSPLRFTHEGQGCLFLSGAQIQLKSDEARVEILAPSQSFTALSIQAGTDGTDNAVPSPACLVIEGADDLLLVDVYVACITATTLVRVRDSARVTFKGGDVYGVAQGGDNTGVNLGAGVTGFSAGAMAIHELARGLVLEDGAQDVSLRDCTIEAESEAMIEVRGLVRGLYVYGLHCEAGTARGAHHFVVVKEAGGVRGGVFLGCEFGALSTRFVEPPRRVFVIDGEWTGVNVLGCFHNGGKEESSAHAVWAIGATATVSDSCDAWNDWDNIELFDGAGRLPVFTRDGERGLQISAESVQLDSAKLGFFGATPVARGPAYTVRQSNARDLRTDSVEAVLSTLLQDLGRLGIVECRVLR